MAEKYGILLIQMMENVDRDLAQLAHCRFLAGDPRGQWVLALTGTGGNGGGGLVCARRLHDWGAEVRVRTTAPADRFTDISGHQSAILERMKVPLDVVDSEEEAPADLIAALIPSANNIPRPSWRWTSPAALMPRPGLSTSPLSRPRLLLHWPCQNWVSALIRPGIS